MKKSNRCLYCLAYGSYQQFKTWANEFDDSSFETKKMMSSQLIKRVEVSEGYRLNIELNITYQQLLEGWTTPILNLVLFLT